MAESTDAFGLSNENSSVNQITDTLAVKNKQIQLSNERFYGAIFLGAVTGVSALIGFGTTLAAVKKRDPKYFEEGIVGIKGVSESGASLALRALGWGTIYAVTGCGLLFYGIWKLSGATNAAEFRYKMGSILPKIPKNDPPQSRTEFEGLTDLLTYISEDWGKNKSRDTDS